jgi:protein SCO1/2
MKRMRPQEVADHRSARNAAFIVLLLFGFLLAGCASKSKEAGRRYHLKGKVVSVNQDSGAVVVDAEAIPGFMDAMAMPYPVRDRNDLTKLGPGDEITADVVVTDDGDHLENVVITKKGGGNKTSPTSNLHRPQPGERVPDFVLTNQDGKRIHLSWFKGKVLLVTFIYTRCRFLDYCPRVSRNFANIYAAIRSDPALNSKTRLLSISFDPSHDTPKILRQYAASFVPSTGTGPFDRWEFATVQPNELDRIGSFFGVYRDSAQDPITHSLSTSVISADGTIYKWYEDNNWKPADLIEDATQMLTRENEASTPTRARLGPAKASGS